MSTSIDRSELMPQACQMPEDNAEGAPAPSLSHPMAGAHASRVDRFDFRAAQAERALATSRFSWLEQEILDNVLKLGRGDVAELEMGGSLKLEGGAGDGVFRARLRRQSDDTYLLEFRGKGALGLGEAASGTAVAATGLVATRQIFQSPEGVADFIQALGPGRLVPFDQAEARRLHYAISTGEAVQLGVGAKIEIGSHGQASGGTTVGLEILGSLGCEVEGGFAVELDFARRTLTLEGSVEAQAWGNVHAPFVTMAQLQGKVRTEAKVEAQVHLSEDALQQILAGQLSVGDLARGVDWKLKVEGQIDGALTATAGGVAQRVTLETEIALSEIKRMSPEGLAEALAGAESRIQVFAAKEEEVGGLGLKFVAVEAGIQWRMFHKVREVTGPLASLDLQASHESE